MRMFGRPGELKMWKNGRFLLFEQQLWLLFGLDFKEARRGTGCGGDHIGHRGVCGGSSCGCSARHKLKGTYNVSDNSMGVSVLRKTDGIAMARPVGITTHVDRTYKTVV